MTHTPLTFPQLVYKLAELAESAISSVSDAEREAGWNIPTFGLTTAETYEARLADLHEPLADFYIRQAGKQYHASDCATSCAPALMPKPCDCEAPDVRAVSTEAIEAGAVQGLVDAARDLIASKADTFTARNGRKVGIQGDDGEKCFIVHSDNIFSLEHALSQLAEASNG